mgnify:CR=1 FL=1
MKALIYAAQTIDKSFRFSNKIRILLIKLFAIDRSRNIYCGFHQQHLIEQYLLEINIAQEADIIESAPLSMKGYKNKTSVQSKYLYTLKNCTVSCFNGLARLPNDKYITESIIARKSAEGFVDLPLPTIRLPLECYVANENNFYHFFTEDIVNIHHLRSMGKEPTVILPNGKQWQVDTLKLLYPEFKVKLTSKFTKIRPLIAYTLTKNTFDSYISNESIKILRSLLCDPKKLTIKEKQLNKIYISRKKAPSRNPINELEFESILQKLGYSIITLEDLSIEQQIITFANAERIVGCHGAGLTLIVTCRKKTQILELFPDDHINYCYASISQRISLNYQYIIYKDNKLPTDLNFLKMLTH